MLPLQTSINFGIVKKDMAFTCVSLWFEKEVANPESLGVVFLLELSLDSTFNIMYYASLQAFREVLGDALRKDVSMLRTLL